jgi:ketosteroid isomerase-like protein
MSRHEDFVRRLYETWNAGGPSAMGDFWTADVVWRDAPDMPDRAEHHGLEATTEYLNGMIETMGGIHSEVQSITDTADGTLVELIARMQGQQSGLGGEIRVFHLMRIAGGRCSEVDVFLDAEQAHAAAAARGASVASDLG